MLTGMPINLKDQVYFARYKVDLKDILLNEQLNGKNMIGYNEISLS